jgi:gamma-glutamyl:cysteine ligase YbdK (ATP-grasp superfamily)
MDTGAANLTDVQKAECVQLTNKINELSEKIQKAQKTLGATAALEVAKQVSFQIQELQEKYKKLCGIDTSSDLTANTELNMVGPGIEPLEEPEPANS